MARPVHVPAREPAALELRRLAVRAAVLAARRDLRAGARLEPLPAADLPRGGGVRLPLAAGAALPVAAALVGGLVFALAPYRVAQSAGHLRGPISALLPLALWAFERSRRGSRWWLRRRGGRARLDPVLRRPPGARRDPVLPALRALPRRAARRGGSRPCLRVGAALLVGHFSTSGIGSGGRSLREVSHYSATGLDFVTRHPRHGLESFVFLGWLTPLLALAGLVLLFARATLRARGGAGDRRARADRCSRWGRTSRSTRRSGTTSRRCATRACRSG